MLERTINRPFPETEYSIPNQGNFVHGSLDIHELLKALDHSKFDDDDCVDGEVFFSEVDQNVAPQKKDASQLVQESSQEVLASPPKNTEAGRARVQLVGDPSLEALATTIPRKELVQNSPSVRHTQDYSLVDPLSASIGQLGGAVSNAMKLPAEFLKKSGMKAFEIWREQRAERSLESYERKSADLETSLTKLLHSAQSSPFNNQNGLNLDYELLALRKLGVNAAKSIQQLPETALSEHLRQRLTDASQGLQKVSETYEQAELGKNQELNKFFEKLKQLLDVCKKLVFRNHDSQDLSYS